ncbi:MAG: hypothetical protein V4608_08080 [Bacteroidota bacterium]
MIEKSKIIVYAKIISVDKEAFKIVTIKKIKSTHKSDTLLLQKFEDWTCASRYAHYEVGQEAIFFIELNKKNEFHTIGAGNEGELVVKSDSVFVPDYLEQKIFPSKKVDFISKYKKYISISIQTAIQGIKIYLDNVDLIGKELKHDGPGNVVYQYTTMDKLPKNYFLCIVIDQKQKGLI